MPGSSGFPGVAATPTQKMLYSQQFNGTSSSTSLRPSFDRDFSQQSVNANATSKPPPNPILSFAPRASSLATTPAPGSFSSNMRSHLASSRAGSALDVTASTANLEKLEEDNGRISEHKIVTLRETLNKELKIKEGSENMLEALHVKKAKQTKEQRQKVEAELNSSNAKIRELKNQITELQRPRSPLTPTRSRMDGLFQRHGRPSPRSASKSAAGSDYEEIMESPTYALAEILQALEVEGLLPDYYVGHANSLANLFKRHPTLKYDLVWSIFGLRIQVMLLSESREVVAAGYRMVRYAISDIHSLQRIRALNTDYLVVLSLIKQSKADVEREHALKLVRAFLDVKDGVNEISIAVVRTISAIAEHGYDEDRHEDRLKSMCIETLSEILIRDPALLITSGGLRPLSSALGEGSYKASEGLTGAFLYLLESPERRRYLQSGYQLEMLFTPFTDPFSTRETTLKQNSKALSLALKNWAGLMTLSMYNFRAIKSLISSMMLPNLSVRETVIDLLYGLLRIKSPFWATSFLAGRRLTTYGRVAGLKSFSTKTTVQSDEESGDRSFVDHYTALLAAVLIESGMLQALLQITNEDSQPMLKRKTTLLLGETLKLASKLLPSSWSDNLQLLPDLFTAASQFGNNNRFVATGAIYQISSVSRTLYQSTPRTAPHIESSNNNSEDNLPDLEEQSKGNTAVAFDETTFRQWLVETQVLSSTNPSRWRWDVILKIIEGPLLNGKRLDEAIKASKFIKRIISFYRPFKYKFAEIRNTRTTQMYVRVGCALMNTLLQTAEGVRYLSDNKLLRQIAECLAQCDPTSGLTAAHPVFSKDRLSESLCSGYFNMLGTLSGDPKGLQMLDRWRMINMMYHIVDLKQRPDLIRLMLSTFDYKLQGHPRVLLSKALTAGSKEIRIHATNVLRKYSSRLHQGGVATGEIGDSKWAIQLLVTQLYDPDIEVCGTAIKILEEACNRKSYLEYIVECRPALDHLGEIGAPLLLRFLSTSIGYHYLDGLDYISNEMDDWFLGRNDSYVGVIEASLARTFADLSEDTIGRFSIDEDGFGDAESEPHVPPHFYRELARTKEGCTLLRHKGHFEEFTSTIRDLGIMSDDAELIVKVKGCLWAVANVGCMENGGPFLEESNVIEYIVRIAQSHELMSLRGTCFFVLGLISRSTHGLEILLEHGWDSVTTSTGESLGLCIPRNLNKLFSLQPWKHQKVAVVSANDSYKARMIVAKTDDNDLNQRILELIIDLGNTVLTKKSINELMQIKQRRAPGFQQVRLFKKIMTLLECHHFPLPVRRFVIDLFDKQVMRRIVLDEDSEEEAGSEGETSLSGGNTQRQRSGSAT